MCQYCGGKFKVGDLPQRVNKAGIGIKALWVHLYCESSWHREVK